MLGGKETGGSAFAFEIGHHVPAECMALHLADKEEAGP